MRGYRGDSLNTHPNFTARRLFRIILLGLMGGTALFSAACAPVVGYPRDPEDTDATLTSLQHYFLPAAECQYQNATPAQKTQIRNEIVLNRMRAYNIEFDNFEKNLWAEGNIITTGGDLIALVLAGLGATTGSAGTKAALSAATAGVVGAQAAINRDLYYQRTLPALLAQMEANRANVELTVLNGLAKSDSEYPLYKAEIDLESLKNAGSMPSAISVITQKSSQDNQSAQKQLAALFTATVVDDATQTRKVAINQYVRGLAASNDKTRLDAIANILKVNTDPNILTERNNIILEMDKRVTDKASMDALSTALKPISNKDY